MFNHPSWVDSILLLYLFAPSGVSRKANLKIPVVGRIIWSFQNIYVSAGALSRPQNADAARSGALDSQQPLLPAAPATTTQQIQDRYATECVVCACIHNADAHFGSQALLQAARRPGCTISQTIRESHAPLQAACILCIA